MLADLSAFCAWSEERSDRTASSLDWRVWAGRAASLVRSLRETTCCLSWALAETAATPNRRTIASIDTHTFTRKCILPPILAGKNSLRIALRRDKKLLTNVRRGQSSLIVRQS